MIGFKKTSIHCVIKNRVVSITVYVCDECGALLLNHGTNAYIRTHKDWHLAQKKAANETDIP